MCCFSVLFGACVFPAAADEPGDSPDYPIFYSFSPPPGWGFPLDPDEDDQDVYPYKPWIVPTLVANKDAWVGSGSDVYDKIKELYFHNLARVPNAYVDHFKAHLAVTKLNFGDSPETDYWAPTGGNVQEQPDVGSVTWFETEARYPERHPWIGHRVEVARDWMVDLRDTWKSDLDNEENQVLPNPVRFLFDTEKPSFGFKQGSESGTVGAFRNYTRLFQAMLADDRATSVDLPIGDPSGQPLDAWWTEAEGFYQETLNVYKVCDRGFESVYGLEYLAAPQNEHHLMLYDRLWAMNLESAHRIAADEVIKDSLEGWPGCKFARYNVFRLPHGEALSPLWSWHLRPSSEAEANAALVQFGVIGDGSGEIPFTFGWTFDNSINYNGDGTATTPPPNSQCVGSSPSGPYFGSFACSAQTTPFEGDRRIGGRPTNVGILGSISTQPGAYTPRHVVTGRHGINTAGFRQGDFDSPVLYGVTEADAEYIQNQGGSQVHKPDQRKPNLYLPPWTAPQDPANQYTVYEAGPNSTDWETTYNACPRDDHYFAEAGHLSLMTCLAPEETLDEASTRVARYIVESIQNAPGADPEALAPYVPLPGAQIFAGVYATGDFLRHLLPMLRAKGVREMYAWSDKGFAGNWSDPAEWNLFHKIYHEVYNWGPSDYAVLHGFINPTGDELNGIRRTLLEDGIPNVLEIESESVGNEHVSSVLVQYTAREYPLQDEGAEPKLRIILEGDTLRHCAGSEPSPGCDPAGGNLKDIRGKVFIFNFDTDAWEQLGVPDFSDGSYGLYAPMERTRPWDMEETFRGTFRTMRRTLDFSLPNWADYLENTGTTNAPEWIMYVKLVQTGTYSFTTRYDLAQVFTLDEPAQSESMMFSSGGTSDYNYNNEINGDDIDAFIEDYVRSKAAADLNNDGNIDSADLARFVSGLSE